VLLAVAAGLGWWQLGAWQERREAEARDLTRVEPVPLTEVLGPDDGFPGDQVGRPVELEGSWVPAGTVFVSGREHDGDDGLWMVVPLAIGSDPAAPALPVVLGWVADRGDAPEPPAGRTELVGWLQPPEGTGARDDDPTDDVLPQLRIADVVQFVDQDLYGAYAIAQEGVAGLPAADLEELPRTGRFTAARNLFYALEWWVFGAFVVLLWWRWLGEHRTPATDEPDQEDQERPDTVAT
jgi:cytochrome oxidase assembly protein ShyY1